MRGLMAWVRRRSWKFWVAAAVVPPIALWFVGGFVVAAILTQPRNVPIAARASLADRAVEAVDVRSADGVTVRGWYVPAAADSARCVVLAAGVGGNRKAMVARGEFYLARGWSTLLVDLRGTGESDPERISMGWHEAEDLRAWHAWLRDRGVRDIAAHGESLGAAAVVYSSVDTAWAWLVLEACYLDIDSAMHNRVPWLPWPHLGLWPMHVASQWLLGVDRAEMRPVDKIRHATMPTLMIYGDRDQSVGDGTAEAMYAASGAAEKRLVWIPGADHVDLWRFDKPRLEAALEAWLASR